VIGIIPSSIITEHLRANLPYHNDECHADPSNDLLKVCVLERHGRNGNIGRGFVKGFGLRQGALAASVGHDSHNVCVVGSDDADMAHAVNRLLELGGGFVAVQGGVVRAELALTFAGLMSLDTFEEVRHKLKSLRSVVRHMGSTLPDPFLQLAFLQLPVIPHLKITDFGLVDVDRFALIES
jgi:adenine deaminase